LLHFGVHFICSCIWRFSPGVIHANLRGIDFGNIFIKIVFDVLFVLALLAFGLKRWQFYRIRQRARRYKLVQANSGQK